MTQNTHKAGKLVSREIVTRNLPDQKAQLMQRGFKIPKGQLRPQGGEVRGLGLFFADDAHGMFASLPQPFPMHPLGLPYAISLLDWTWSLRVADSRSLLLSVHQENIRP